MTKFRFGGPARYKHQVKALKKVIDTKGVCALLLDPGLGKGHPLDEPVLTPEGWRPVGDLEVGDYVIGSDGTPTRVTGVYDRGVLPTYLVEFTDGASVRVDKEHLWKVLYKSNGRIERATVKDTQWLIGVNNPTAYYIPRTAVEGRASDLPLDPYLLGALIADGYLAGNGVTWTKNDQSVVLEMRKACERQGVKLTDHKRHEGHATCYGVTGISKDLRALGLCVKSADKRIPEVYFHAPREDRIALLAGLFDGDGSVRLSRGTARYATVSEGLAKDVRDLLWSLGVPASITWQPHYVRGHWYVQIRGDFNPFWGHPQAAYVTGPKRPARRSFKSVTRVADEPIRCISVEAEDSLYVAKDYIVTHNTAVTLDYASILALKSPTQEVRVLVVAPLVATDSWVIQAPVWSSPDVNVWAEVLGGSIIQKAEALAARGGKPFRTLPTSKGERRQIEVPEGTDPRANGVKRSGSLVTRPEIAPESGPGALDGPRVVIEVINMDAFSKRNKYGSKLISDILLDAVKRYSPDLVVVDESHLIKGVGSNVSRLMARISDHVKHRVILTGTLMPHSPMDVFAQWRFLEPYAFGWTDKWGERRKATDAYFKDRFAKMGGYMGREIVGWQNLDEMNEIMARNAVVIRKEDALDLPPYTDEVVPVHLSAKEQRAYQAMKQELATAVLSEEGTHEFTAQSRLTQLMRLRQITAGHMPDDEGNLVEIGTSKVSAIHSHISEVLTGERRIVVFGVFKHEIHAIAEALRKDKGTTVEVITGDTPVPERIAIRKRFGSDDPARIIIVAQIRTLSLAVNELVTASHAVFASLSQQRDHYVQARDRLNRIGQRRNMTFWHFIAPGTVDEVQMRVYQTQGNLETAMLEHVRRAS